MMERFKRDRAGSGHGTTGATRVAEPGRPADHDRVDDRAERVEHVEHRRGGIDRDQLAAARSRQREEYGGINWGAAIFGFLAAAGLGAILTALVSAAGATLTLGTGGADSGAAETIGIAGGIALLVVLVISYFAGGYVAGRMSRFDGARQGLGVFLVGLIVTLVLAAAGAVLGAEYNVLAQLNLPRIPIEEGDVATGALIALLIGVVGSVLAAMAGGKAGERYHRKIDRLAIDR